MSAPIPHARPDGVGISREPWVSRAVYLAHAATYNEAVHLRSAVSRVTAEKYWTGRPWELSDCWGADFCERAAAEAEYDAAYLFHFGEAPTGLVEST